MADAHGHCDLEGGSLAPEGASCCKQASPGTQVVPAVPFWAQGNEEGETGLVSRLLWGLCVPFGFRVGQLTESGLLLLLPLPPPPWKVTRQEINHF